MVAKWSFGDAAPVTKWNTAFLFRGVCSYLYFIKFNDQKVNQNNKTLEYHLGKLKVQKLPHMK